MRGVREGLRNEIAGEIKKLNNFNPRIQPGTEVKRRLEYYAIMMLLPAILLAGSCMPEKEVAKQFLENPVGINILLIPAQTLYKYNHKGESILHFDSLTDAQQDSALYENSRFIKFVDDSSYLDTYVNSFIDELRELGFKVYLDTAMESYLAQQPQSYRVKMAQVQLDEYVYPYEDQEAFYDSIYTRIVELNAVDASTWFELNKITGSRTKKTVLYSTFTSTDEFNGRFYNDPLTGDVHFTYTINSLNFRDLYELAQYYGRKQASYLFDYFMNQYITYHMPQGMSPEGYFHYNRFKKTVVRTDDEGFEVLDNP
jgi:hypothetical protein